MITEYNMCIYNGISCVWHWFCFKPEALPLQTMALFTFKGIIHNVMNLQKKDNLLV